MGWWSDIWRTRAEDWTYAELPAEKTPEGLVRSEVLPESAYLSIVLRSVRIVNVRKGLTKFYAVTHSFISLTTRPSGKTVEVQAVSTPSNLEKLDAANVDRVIQMNHSLLGPTPYRGLGLGLELGLFSVKEADLAKPYLDLLTDISSKAGVAYLNAALPFAGPITRGINLLSGAEGDTTLEIGISAEFQRVTTGYYAVIRAPKGQLDPRTLRVDNDHRLVDDASGRPIRDFPYLVFSITASPEREAFYAIPELGPPYQQLSNAVAAGNKERIQELWLQFSYAVKTSPDLLYSDAKEILRRVREYVDNAWTESRSRERISSAEREGPAETKSLSLPHLSAIDIYDQKLRLAAAADY